MTLEYLRLRITTPTRPIEPGRGFYQLEEDALYVQIGLFDTRNRFFSYLESETVRLDFDRNARLIFVELSLPRRAWSVQDELEFPEVIEMADIRWLDFRETIKEPTVTTNRDRTMVRIRYSSDRAERNFYLARTVVAQVDSKDNLVAIWVERIEDDIAGREIATFRKRCRKGWAVTV